MKTARMKRIAPSLGVLVLLFAGSMHAAQEPVTYQEKHKFSTTDLQLDLFIREAMERNPAIAKAFSLYQASLTRTQQAGSLPDPMVGITQYLRTPETRVGPQTTTLTLSQQFPWFGKLAAKEGIAAKEAAVLGQQYEAQRDEIIRQVKLAYYDLAYLDRAITITEEDASLLDHYETLAQARYSQGVGLQQAVVKLQAELTKNRNRLETLRSRRVEAETALNSLRDYPAGSPIKKIGPLTPPKADIDLEALLQAGKEYRPEVQGAFLMIERDEERIQLARKNFWPDITLGAGFTNVLGRSDLAPSASLPSQNGKNIFALTVGINIPIRRRKYDSALTEATEDKIASREAYRSAVNAVEASIRAVGFRLETLERQIALFEGTLLPQAEQALSSAEAAYSTGSLGILDLLDSERVLLDVRLGSAQLTSDYMKARAEMERAIGQPF